MRKNKEMNKAIVKKITDKLDVSTELMNNCVLLKICGNMEVMMENHKGIIDYSDRKIYIKGKPFNVEIIGEMLEIRNLTDETLYITGEITGVCFVDYDKNI